MANSKPSTVVSHQAVGERFAPLVLVLQGHTVSFQLRVSGQTGSEPELRRLRRGELAVDTLKLARYLIGKVLVHDTDFGRLSGRIVETEAYPYPIGDSAGHAFRGRTPRNSSLFLERGQTYVYLAYGLSFLLDVTSEVGGVGGGVLLRAIERELSAIVRNHDFGRSLGIQIGNQPLPAGLSLNI
jgi:DNA-3-methyladenine glycosylase